MAPRGWIIISLLVLLTSAIFAVGLYYKHYYSLLLFSGWLVIEGLILKHPDWKKKIPSPQPMFFKGQTLLKLYKKFDNESQKRLDEELNRLYIDQGLSSYEQRWVERFSCLVELKKLMLSDLSSSRWSWKHALVRNPSPSKESFSFNRQAITEAAIQVAELHWKLYDCAMGKFKDLQAPARNLYSEIYGKKFDDISSRIAIEKQADSLQRNGGVSYLILNLLGHNHVDWARSITQEMIREGEDSHVEEGTRSALYWMVELKWFEINGDDELKDQEAVIRNLYHLCFLDPERGGFLEIDSRFFTSFTAVNEIAQEGFLFKEVLVEKILNLWAQHPGNFDEQFKPRLESMTGTQSKVYDEYETWRAFWERDKEDFCREYLYVIEGNLSYAKGLYQEAAHFYERALSISPDIRSALLNTVFAHARMGNIEPHYNAVERVLQADLRTPLVFCALGNSCLLLDDPEQAALYYSEVRLNKQWSLRVDYIISTFCYENGLFELATDYAESAALKNPNQFKYLYHLSQCYYSNGLKERALETVRSISNPPEWMHYYRFTLEKETGKLNEASETLLHISSEYFEDKEELDEALEFARLRKDFSLLRHLRKSESKIKE